MSLEQRHLSPSQILEAAPGIVRRFLSLGYTAVEQSIDEFRQECTVRGHQHATRTKYINNELVDNRYKVDVAIVPDDRGGVSIEYRFSDGGRPVGGIWNKIVQTLDNFNINEALRAMR